MDPTVLRGKDYQRQNVFLMHLLVMAIKVKLKIFKEIKLQKVTLPIYKRINQIKLNTESKLMMNKTKISMDEGWVKRNYKKKWLKRQSMENTGERISDIIDIMRWANLNGIGIPEDKREKMKEAIFENISNKNVPKLMKSIKSHFKRPKQTQNLKKKTQQPSTFYPCQVGKGIYKVC